MRRTFLQTVAFRTYLAVFLLLLLAPLIVMTLSAFNTAAYPQALPFEGFTLNWFRKFAQSRDLLDGVWSSLRIATVVTLFAVPIGLAAALVMNELQDRFRPFYYIIVMSPMLTPGIIIGVSTVVFWRAVSEQTGFFGLYNGFTLTVLAQITFVSALCMLVSLSRLQRFDRSQEEAALDLGASPLTILLTVKLPFLRPAVISAVVLAVLSSVEEFNATTFTILADKTLTTVLAGRIRAGLSPEISALAVIIIGLTLLGAVLYEITRRGSGK